MCSQVIMIKKFLVYEKICIMFVASAKLISVPFLNAWTQAATLIN